MKHEGGQWALLFKLGQLEHIQNLRSEGLLHFNPLRYFSSRESSLNSAQHDSFEGSDEIIQPHDLKAFVVESGGVKTVLKSEHFVGPIQWSLGQSPPPNIYCMYALTDPTTDPILDPKNFQFGNACTMVLRTDEFIDRVKEAAQAAGFQLQWGPVSYFDKDNHSGKTGPFSKPSTFSYQSEFRFALHPGRDSPVQLVLGDLSDLTTDVVAPEEVNEVIKINLPETAP